MPAVSATACVLFTGTMTDALRNAVEEYGAERLQPGDVLMSTTPYRAGTHINDLMFIRPVFHEDQIVGFVNIRAHMLDMGGIVPARLLRHQAQHLRERPRHRRRCSSTATTSR